MLLQDLSRHSTAAVRSPTIPSRAPSASAFGYQPLRPASSSQPQPEQTRPGRLQHACANNNGAGPSPPYDTLETLQCNLTTFKDCDFFRVEAIFRPWRLDHVVAALSKQGIMGMTAYQVTGHGVQGGKKERYSGTEYGIASLVQKSKLDVVVHRDQVNKVVQVIASTAHTGEIGDGKIFVHPVVEVIRIRTGEHGQAAERMEGGMADLGVTPDNGA